MTDMEIETFLTVLRSGSMTAAAQALYITQPTLSARLQTLEDEVGTPLFVRGKGLRRLELTEAGTRFLPLAQRWQRLMAEMHGIAAAEARTHFRIGAAYTANQYVLRRYTSGFWSGTCRWLCGWRPCPASRPRRPLPAGSWTWPLWRTTWASTRSCR